MARACALVANLNVQIKTMLKITSEFNFLPNFRVRAKKYEHKLKLVARFDSTTKQEHGK
jgi:hypothetical protein